MPITKIQPGEFCPIPPSHPQIKHRMKQTPATNFGNIFALNAKMKLFILASILAGMASPTMADQVVVTAYTSASVLTAPPTYQQTVGTWSGSGSGSHSAAD